MRRFALLSGAIILLGMLGPTARAQEVHTENCLHGCPTGAPGTNDLIVRPIYMLSSNDSRKFADWVAYVVTAESQVGSESERKWKSDPVLDDSETLEPNDYDGFNNDDGTNWDRGHQAPLAAFTGTPHWRQTNYLSNITPQRRNLNQGRWKFLEQRVRQIAATGGVDTVYVVTGPLYEGTVRPLPGADEPHQVPSGYWKVIATEVSGADEIRVSSFIFPQVVPDRKKKYCEHVKTLAEVETRSGLDLFPDFDGSVTEGSADLGCAAE